MLKTLNIAIISLILFTASETIQQEVKPNFQVDLYVINEIRLEERKELVEIKKLDKKTENTKNLHMFSETDTKTYMDYRKITDRTSAQYKLIHSDKIFVNKKGFLQTSDGFIGVAMGSYFGDIGSKFIVKLSTGKELKLIKVERKADIHTDSYNFKGNQNFDIIEFVIDTKTIYMKQNIYDNNFIFGGNFNNCNDYKGTIIEIKKVL